MTLEMNVTASGFKHFAAIHQENLLVNDEVVAVVDDDYAIRESLCYYFQEQGLAVVEAKSGEDFLKVLSSHNVALALLDIGLPDLDGNSLLPRLKEDFPNISIVMLTGVSDLQTALDCLRSGADDYLAKPTLPKEVVMVVKKNLERRRLTIQNRQYQEELETANFRIELMHQLSLKMNSVYLNTVELDEILQAILVGITANEGLRFNRAFLAMIDEKEHVLRGRLGIGPGCREDAGKIWGELQEKRLDFLELVKQSKTNGDILSGENESEVNKHIKQLQIGLDETDNILIKCAFEKKSTKVSGGKANGLDLSAMVDFLNTDEFVVVPLYSPRRALGVIIADNYVTQQPISHGHVNALELFSSQASLAIEHSHLYVDMQNTIGKLEDLNHELDKNKDMLIEAERYSALGQMAAQVVHNIRNPITAIGGVSRILAKKIKGQGYERYTDVMTKETSRLEATLEELFDFVSQTEISLQPTIVYTLLEKVILLVQGDINKQNINLEIDFSDPDLSLNIDPKLIRKMLVHLLMNAIEAMQDGGRLTIKIYPEDRWLNISIVDTGHCLDEDHIKKAREPFFTTKTYGTGMGLAMVDRIVSAHDGNFVLMNSDSGTEVLVKLPRDKD